MANRNFDNKPTATKDSTNNRPKPMIPKTALKRNGKRYKNGGTLKK